MRSRTGCLTCRQRKLKCDEQKPVCSQCRKASRECRPSEGIVFRHQQNASMNSADDAASPTDRSLRGFYAYKNTFDEDSVWLDIPKRVTFVDNSDPYAEDLDGPLASPDRLLSDDHNGGWNMDVTFSNTDLSTPPHGLPTHGLEALSAAATRDRFSFIPPPSPSNTNISRAALSFTTSVMPSVSLSPSQPRNSMPPPTSPSISISSNNNINFLLNPSSISPPIDPNLQSPVGRRETPTNTSSLPPSLRSMPSEFRTHTKVETEHEIAFLLRHFSEAPGLWMDLFDQGTYFGSYVPVKALTNPLLKSAACAYSAKQLGRVRGAKAIWGGPSSNQASMEVWPDAENVDWYWLGAKYYDKAIQLLMEALQNNGSGPNLNNPEAFGQWQAGELCEDGELGRKRRRRSSTGRLSSVDSDEVLAASVILSVYEFLDGSGPAWSRHLSGAKSLLDIAEVGMMPIEDESGNTFPSPPRMRSSKARKAVFWNFARQDLLAAFVNESQTRLSTEDLIVWKDAGLLLDDDGFVCPSNTTHSGYPEGDDVMREDMIANALIWLLSKLVNFMAAGDGLILNDTPLGTPSPLGINQQTLLERWGQLEDELEGWFQGLPETFKPCARVEPPRLASQTSEDDGSPFPEIWFSIPMCASTMQHYHMARILLLINKPHESTAGRSTVTNRLRSYRSIESEIRFHSHEICGIAMARPDASVRVHSLQPLFVSGQCLTEARERRIILNLIRTIEKDTGWATEYRVKQLLKEWEWDEGRDGMDMSG